jgi:hypothetical protein
MNNSGTLSTARTGAGLAPESSLGVQHDAAAVPHLHVPGLHKHTPPLLHLQHLHVPGAQLHDPPKLHCAREPSVSLLPRRAAAAGSALAQRSPPPPAR